MPRIFRLDASIIPAMSTTRLLADRVESALASALPGEPIDVTRRDVASDPLPATAWGASLVGSGTPEEDRTPEQREALALASRLADELADADAFVFAAPLYNWGVSQHIKAWVDLVGTEPRFAPRSETVAGRPAVLVTARGGSYAPGTPRADWDHATAWYTRIFQDTWGLDLRMVSVELTLAPHREYLAEFRDQAAESLAAATASADELGAWVASRLPSPALV
jgi:FMN-dependent NADH-azoreductase